MLGSMNEVILRASSAQTFMVQPRHFVLGEYARIKSYARSRVLLHSQITSVGSLYELSRLRGHRILPWDQVVDCSGPSFPQQVREAFYDEIWRMTLHGGSSAPVRRI